MILEVGQWVLVQAVSDFQTNDQVRRLLRHEHNRDPSLRPEELARLCHEQSGVSISRRTVYRVLADGGAEKNKRRSKRTLRRD